MNREDTREEILKLENKSVLLELPTGFGKSLIGMDLCLKYDPKTILIVIPRLVLINNWKEEFKKWENEKYLERVQFITYAGIHKIGSQYDCIIFDEAHHITERVMEYLGTVKYNRAILLSATVKRDLKSELRGIFPDLYLYKVSMKSAIDANVLPDPQVYLMPLSLDTLNNSETIVKHSSGRLPVTCLYKDRWNYLRNKNIKLTIQCTPFQKNLDMDNDIEFWKNKYMRSRSEIFKNKWLHLAGERLKFLSNQKNVFVKRLLSYLHKERVLTFCNSIEQTEVLGKHCINSKNKNSLIELEAFNKGEINQITACNMLNEGMNLSSCRIGVYAVLNSSETLIKQKLGRILRHRNPIIIIPYYKGTREEELVQKMIEEYSEDSIISVDSINDIKL